MNKYDGISTELIKINMTQSGIHKSVFLFFLFLILEWQLSCNANQVHTHLKVLANVLSVQLASSVPQH